MVGLGLFFHDSSLVEDVEEAPGDGLGTSLGVHVQLIICTQSDMFAVGVGSIVGESLGSFFSRDIKTGVATDKDVFRHLGLVPGRVQRLVGEDGEVGFGGIIIPGSVLQHNDLFGFERRYQELS